MTTSNPAQADLLAAVTTVAGVRGIEPSVTSALRVFSAHVLGTRDDATRFGIIIDPDAATITVEVGVDGSRAVREIVSDIQQAVKSAVEASGFTVIVHVKSLS